MKKISAIFLTLIAAVMVMSAPSIASACGSCGGYTYDQNYYRTYYRTVDTGCGCKRVYYRAPVSHCCYGPPHETPCCGGLGGLFN